MGKFEELNQSNDAEIRTTKVRMSNGRLMKRPSTETKQPNDIEMDEEIDKECTKAEYPKSFKLKRVASNAQPKIRLLSREEIT